MSVLKAFVVVACSAAAYAQQGPFMGGSVTRDNGPALFYETRVEPPTPGLASGIGGGMNFTGSAYHRFLYDAVQNRYLGYDLVVEPMPTGLFRLTFKPLSIGPDKMRLPSGANWTSVPLPRYPVQQTVHAGDKVSLDLLVNPATGQRIVDYLTVGSPLPRSTTVAGPARDFSIHDVEIRLIDPKLSIDGKWVEATANQHFGVSGSVAWFYLPDRGRFLLSLLSFESLGFRKAGETRGDSLSFQWGGETYSLKCSEGVTPGRGAFNLYVLADPAYRPTGPDANAPFLMGAADRPEYLLRRR